MKTIRYERLNYFFLNSIFCCIIFFSCKSNDNAAKSLCPDTIFVSEIWKKSQIDQGKMVNDLIKNNRLATLSKDSVTNLLGTPTEEGTHFVNYLIDMNCGKKKYGLMLLHVEIDTTANKVIDCFLTD
jgi:hypothetical protein